MENAQTHALDKEIILDKRSKTSNKSYNNIVFHYKKTGGF